MDDAKKFLDLAKTHFGKTITSKQIKFLVDSYGLEHPFWFVNDTNRKAGRGVFKVMIDDETVSRNALEDATDYIDLDDTDTTDDNLNVSSDATDDLNLVPKHHRGYVKFGFYDDLVKIINTRQFWPIFIAGESGFGKTQMVYEACHKAKRELIRVQISPETDKTSLLYVPNLKDGTLTHDHGPVPEAMLRGAILLLDEIDRGTDKLICLNGILEGKPWYNEKTQEVIYPKPGFNVIATGNSKGQGTLNSSYLVRILDNAFLERFAITVEHEPPSKEIEEIILTKVLEKIDIHDQMDFATKLTQWSHWIRETINDGSDDVDMVSTRRLINICEAYKIFQNRSKSIAMCITRFDKNVQQALLKHYELIDLKAHIDVPLKAGELFGNME